MLSRLHTALFTVRLRGECMICFCFLSICYKQAAVKIYDKSVILKTMKLTPFFKFFLYTYTNTYIHTQIVTNCSNNHVLIKCFIGQNITWCLYERRKYLRIFYLVFKIEFSVSWLIYFFHTLKKEI